MVKRKMGVDCNRCHVIICPAITLACNSNHLWPSTIVFGLPLLSCPTGLSEHYHFCWEKKSQCELN